VAVALATADARAQNKQAEALYEQGLAQMLEDDFAGGCPKLDKSYQLDPLLGALFTLAACYERWGKVHSAALRYEEFNRKASALPPDEAKKQEERIRTAIGKLAQLKPRIPTLQLDGSPPPGATVTLDGAPVDASSLGTPMPTDPGEHVVTVGVGGGTPSEQRVSLAEGATETLVLDIPSGSPEYAPAGAGAEPEADSPDEGSDGSAMTTAAFVVGGVGVAGIVVGAVTGGLVFSKKGDVDDGCDDNRVCTPEGKKAADDAKTLGLISTVTFAVGGAALAAGVLLFVLAPDDAPDEHAALRLHIGSLPGDPRSGTLGVRGAW
jgi:hypothetical protein